MKWRTYDRLTVRVLTIRRNGWWLRVTSEVYDGGRRQQFVMESAIPGSLKRTTSTNHALGVFGHMAELLKGVKVL